MTEKRDSHRKVTVNDRDAAGRFSEGNAAAGSRKGQPNRFSGTMKEMIKAVLEERRERFVRAIDALPDDVFIETYVRLLAYLVPKPVPGDPISDRQQIVVYVSDVDERLGGG